MILCGLDLETTGITPEKNRIIEVGAVLWDTELKQPVSILSQFCWKDGFPESEPGALSAHGITSEMAKKYGQHPTVVLVQLNSMFEQAEAVVAHNGAQFDEGFYIEESNKEQVPPVLKTWIDTVMDVKYPPEITTRKLTHLAAEHGFLNPFPHRAVFDVLTMLRVLQHYDCQAVLDYARQPAVTLWANVTFDDRQKAKDRGYRWHPDRKKWLKNVRLPDKFTEQRDAGFDVREVPS